MKIAITGDLHENSRHFNEVIKAINAQNVDLNIFVGDFDMPFTMRNFTLLNAPIKAVLGNGDPDIQKFQYQLQNLPILKGLKLDIAPKFQDITADGKRIGVFHGDDETLTNFLVESQLLDVLCIGHNHIPEIKTVGKTLIINPGSIVGWMLERGNMNVNYALYDTTTNKADLIKVID